MEKNCGITHLEKASVVPQYQILTKLQKYHIGVALLASGTPANGGGNGACMTTLPFSITLEFKKVRNGYLGGSGACLAMHVRLISEPARTNSSGPESISAFDTGTKYGYLKV